MRPSFPTHMDRNNNKRFLLLLDGAAAPGNNVQAWLTEKGLVTWAANDVCHALEELSDFTVTKRPDVVMLEVAMLMETFDDLRSTFEEGTGDDVTVVALGKNSRSRDKFFAGDLDQLKTLLCDEMALS